MDIREIIAALSPDDRALWSEHRTAMRRSFLTAHNMTVGIGNWSANDDAFADLIDIQLALLFDRAGRIEAHKDIIGVSKGEAIVAQIQDQASNLKQSALGRVDAASGWVSQGQAK